MRVITISITDAAFEQLEEIAEKTQKSKSKVVRELIKEAYEKLEGIELPEEPEMPKKKETEPKMSASKGKKVVERIVDRMKEMGLYEANEVPAALIRNIISDIAGYDSRTVNKYFEILDRQMLLPENVIMIRKKKSKVWG